MLMREKVHGQLSQACGVVAVDERSSDAKGVRWLGVRGRSGDVDVSVGGHGRFAAGQRIRVHGGACDWRTCDGANGRVPAMHACHRMSNESGAERRASASSLSRCKHRLACPLVRLRLCSLCRRRQPARDCAPEF